MNLSTDLPHWIEQLRSEDPEEIVIGPDLGPTIRNMLSGAASMDLDPLAVLWGILSHVSSITIPDAIGAGLPYSARFIPGHVGYKPLFGWQLDSPSAWPSFRYGPYPGCADIVVVGKHPGRDEEITGYLFTGASGREVKETLETGGIPDFLDKAYFTNVCRFQPPGGKFKQAWVKESRWFTWAEIAIIRPKMILALGGDAIKFFHGSSHSVSKSRGYILPVTWNTADGDIEIDTFGTVHPAYVAREPVQRDSFVSDLIRCRNATVGNESLKLETNYDSDPEAATLRTLAMVEAYVEQAMQQGRKEFAIDCEWRGKSVWSGNGQLLTVQLSHAPGHAVLIPVNKHLRVPFPTRFEQTKWPDIISFIGEDYEGASDTSGAELFGYVRIDSGGEIIRDATIEVLNRGVANFSAEDEAAVVAALRKLLLRPDVRVGGHSFRADFPWLKHWGIDLTDQFLRGFDSMLWHHLLHEAADQSLTACILKYTDMDRYDVELHAWLAKHDIADSEGHKKDQGFGAIPEHLLYIYALKDADGSFRVFKKVEEALSDDTFEYRGELRKLMWSALRACPGILEIEETGMCADRDRILHLAAAYTEKREELTAELREFLNWPEFNPRSVQHCKEMLFGAKYNGKKRIDPNVPISVRPDGAYCANLTPVKSTDRPPIPWARIAQKGEEDKHSASTDKESLGILGSIDPAAEQLRRIRFVDQVVKTYVSVPTYDPETGEQSEGGLLRYIDVDGRIRTSIFQCTETSRWSSSRPNLQNLPKKREPMLHSYFDARRVPPKVRSVLVAPPGQVIVEADYMQAEMVVLALLSGDINFWNVLMSRPEYRVLIDNDSGEIIYWLHPEWTRDVIDLSVGDVVPPGTVFGQYRSGSGEWSAIRSDRSVAVATKKWSRDLHAEVAISGFRLPYSAVTDGPPRKWMESHSKDKRVAAKSVNFGIPYGRSAGAIARELQQEGVPVTEGETQAMIDGYLTDYSLVAEFLDLCKFNVSNPYRGGSSNGYLITASGRRRRFQRIDDRGKMAAQEREACNFPIQGEVAECLNKAVYNAWVYRRCAALAASLPSSHPRAEWMQNRFVPMEYCIILGVHDALQFYAPPCSLPEMLRPGGMIDFCMSDQARIPLPDKSECHGLYRHVDDSKFPYAVAVDKEVSLRWDETPSRDEMERLGVPEEYLPEEE